MRELGIVDQMDAKTALGFDHSWRGGCLYQEMMKLQIPEVMSE